MIEILIHCLNCKICVTCSVLLIFHGGIIAKTKITYNIYKYTLCTLPILKGIIIVWSLCLLLYITSCALLLSKEILTTT